MADDISIELWLDRRRLEALDEALTDIGYDHGAENYMQDRLIDLYCETVPTEVQTAIDQELAAERLADEQRVEECKKVSAFHVMEHGKEQYFATDDAPEFLMAAIHLRHYLTKEQGAGQLSFAQRYPCREEISADDFDSILAVHMENTGKVCGVYDINFDKREFSAVNIMDGWQTFALGDVSTAAYHATRKRFLSVEQQYEKLLDHLDGKEITSAGHLSARNFSFSDEIMEDDGKLDFYIDTTFDVDAVFGTLVCTDENDDYINLYADYDMESGQVCDELTIILWKGDGQSEEMSYALNAAEKEVLLRKMDEYCQQQTGMALGDYSAQRMAEQDAPMTQPTM